MQVEDGVDLPIIDHDVFDEIKEVLEDEFVEMIDEYMEDADSKINQLLLAANEAKLDVIRDISHAFSSSSAHLGFMRLSALLKSAEIKAKEGAQANYVELVESICGSYQDVLRTLDG